MACGVLGCRLMTDHSAVAGVDAQHQPARKRPAHPPKPIRLLQRQRADDQPRQAEVQPGSNRLLAPDSSAKLAGNARTTDNRGHGLGIGRTTQPSAVEIDHMEPVGPLGDPALGDGGRIVAENRFAPIISLLEANALSPPQIDCRPDFHARRLLAQGGRGRGSEKRPISQIIPLLARVGGRRRGGAGRGRGASPTRARGPDRYVPQSIGLWPATRKHGWFWARR